MCVSFYLFLNIWLFYQFWKKFQHKYFKYRLCPMRSVRSFHSVFTYFIFFHIFYLFASLCYILHSFFIPSSAMSKLLHILNFKSVTIFHFWKINLVIFQICLSLTSFFFLNNFKSFFYWSNQYIEYIIPKSDVFMGLSCWFCWFLLKAPLFLVSFVIFDSELQFLGTLFTGILGSLS